MTLREHRESRHMTLSEVANEVYMTTSHLSMIERGKCTPSINMLANICNVLNIDIKDVIDEFID